MLLKGLRFCQNLKYEHFTSPFGRYVKTKHKTICGTCESRVQQDYFSAFNQSNHWFLALLLPFWSPFLKLPIDLLWHDNIFAKSRSKMIMILSFFLAKMTLVWARFLLLYEKTSYSQSFSTSNLKLSICALALQGKLDELEFWEKKKQIILSSVSKRRMTFQKIIWSQSSTAFKLERTCK